MIQCKSNIPTNGCVKESIEAIECIVENYFYICETNNLSPCLDVNDANTAIAWIREELNLEEEIGK